MAETQVLEYDDFLARVEKLARERDGWPERAAVSLPAVAGELRRTATGDAFLLAFLYQAPMEGVASSGFAPYALVQLRPDGGLVQWTALPPVGEIGRGASRFRGDAAHMTPDEQEAFLETYYQLLVSPQGPLLARSRADAEFLADLKTLFETFAEEPLLPLYRRYTRDYLALIGYES